MSWVCSYVFTGIPTSLWLCAEFKRLLQMWKLFLSKGHDTMIIFFLIWQIFLTKSVKYGSKRINFTDIHPAKRVTQPLYLWHNKVMVPLTWAGERGGPELSFSTSPLPVKDEVLSLFCQNFHTRDRFYLYYTRWNADCGCMPAIRVVERGSAFSFASCHYLRIVLHFCLWEWRLNYLDKENYSSSMSCKLTEKLI